MVDKTSQTEGIARVGSDTPIVCLGELGELIYRKRKEDGLTLEQVGQQIGVSAATLSRWERQRAAHHGTPSGEKLVKEPDMRTLAAVTRWLGVALDKVAAVEPPSHAHGVMHHASDTTPDIVAAHLRADPKLNPKAAKALADMFGIAYQQFAELPLQTPTGRHPEKGQEDEETE